jgi:hypothetical protein
MATCNAMSCSSDGAGRQTVMRVSLDPLNQSMDRTSFAQVLGLA